MKFEFPRRYTATKTGNAKIQLDKNLEPDNWDAIYNYELTKRLFEELRKKPKTPPKQLLELLMHMWMC